MKIQRRGSSFNIHIVSEFQFKRGRVSSLSAGRHEFSVAPFRAAVLKSPLASFATGNTQFGEGQQTGTNFLRYT